jgi:signal transduction histidine kinase
VLPTYTVPRTGIFKKYYDKGQKGETLWIEEFSGKACVAHYETMSALPVIGAVLLQLKKTNNGYPTYQIDHVVYFKYGYLLFITKEHVPEAHDIFKRFAKVFEQTYTRFLDLQKAEAQTREAQIEAALERTRTQSMLMQHSDELNVTAQVFHQQLQLLGIDSEFSYLWLPDEAENNHKFWATWSETKKGKTLFNNKTVSFPLDKKEPSIAACYQAWESEETVHLNTVQPDEVKDYFATWDDLLSGVTKFKPKLFPDGLYYIDAYMKYGCFGIMTKRLLTEAENHILSRFSKEFERTYSRFLGLQKAEAQAREAQIEMALEKVRSRTMAMQQSEELPEAANNLFLQVQGLGIPAWSAGYCIWENDKKSTSCNMSSEGEIQKEFSLPTIGEGYNFADPLKNGEPFHVSELGGKALVKHYDFMKKLPIVGEVLADFDKKGISLPTFQIFHIVYFSHGYLMFITYEPVPKDWDIFKRFGKVFEQTYTRFLDLKKAEAQAREAQIEMALEKVRSRTMAMQHSEELAKAAQVLFSEVQALGIPSWSCGYNLLNDDNTAAQCWMSSEEIIQEPFILEYKKEPSFIEMYEFFESDDSFLIQELGGKTIESHYNYMKSIPSLTERFDDFEKEGMALPKYQINHLCKFNKGYLLFITYEKVPEAHDIFRRFTTVFEQTYTRFIDLKKAEAQAREAQIETALEKVRSRSMAMHTSEELLDVITVVSEQLQYLEFKFVHVSFANNDMGQDYKFWTSSPGRPKPMRFNVPYKDIAVFNNLRNAQEKSLSFCTDIVTKKEHNQWHKHLLKHGGSDVFSKKDNAFIMSRGMARSVAINPNILLILANYASIPYSETDNKIIERFGQVFEQSYTRFLDLQKAEAQTRTAQINLAVERVRAKALAMHQSEEIMDVVAKLKDEVMSLDIPDVVAATIFLNEGDDKVRMWDLSTLEQNNDGYQIPFDITFKLKKRDPNLYVKRVWDNPENYFLELQEAKDFKRIIAWLRENNKIEIADEVEEFIETTHLKQLHHAVKKLNNGKLVIDLMNPPSDEMETILTKMGAAFDLAYKRFEDLQKAEAQTREALIEAALEKVRSRSLAMHKPDELQEVVSVVAEKLQELDVILDAGGVIICTYFPDNKDVIHWISAPDFSHSGSYFVPYFDNPIFTDAWDSKNRGDAYFSKEFSVETKNEFFEYAFEHSDYKNFSDDYKQHVLKADKHRLSAAWSKNSAIIIPSLTGGEPSESDAEIIKRFAKVFEQAYIRFMDLQKAEEHAQEAKIEASLEKVRTVALTLTKSDDMLDIAQVLYEQLLVLGFTDMRNAIIDIHNDDETFLDYDYSHDMSSAVTLFSFYGDPVIEQQIKKVESSNDAFFEIELKGKELKELIATRLRNGEKDDPRLHEIDHLTYNLYSFGNGAIGISNFGILSDDQKKVLKRFRNVFTFAYKRYTDLAKAEAQAQEAKIEAALEKVRSVTLSLSKSEDMVEVSQALYEQLLALGFSSIRNALIDIDNDDGATFLDYDYSHDMGRTVTLMSYKDDPTLKEQLKDIMATTDGFSEMILEGKQLQDLIEMRRKNGEAEDLRLLNTDSISYILYAFGKGAIGISNFGVLTEHQKTILSRFRKVFTFAYQRYTDLAQSEVQAANLLAEKQRLEATLANLQATQKQLIQSEKMASLGELTAGIAHEIQNPLNFVNNFSELSNELIDEMNAEIEKGDLEEAKFISKDIKQNLEKIYHHGKRAEAIVKGMLQHSRKTSEEKEPTDINKLADEYFRLAYHGLRARNKSFNATLVTDYDESVGKILTFPQDLGRVILNLVTNAFYAVNEKQRNPLTRDHSAGKPEGGINGSETRYEPTVWVRTKRISPLRGQGGISISVSDNGSGIPTQVLDKIFQPFFTTKPTGQGTGLGLSMSYDIITTGHGGELTVETKEHTGTEFTIVLPI